MSEYIKDENKAAALWWMKANNLNISGVNFYRTQGGACEVEFENANVTVVFMRGAIVKVVTNCSIIDFSFNEHKKDEQTEWEK